jgi:hypothetical protein
MRKLFANLFLTLFYFLLGINFEFTESCSNLFRYYRDFGGTYGQVTISQPGLQIKIRLDVMLSVGVITNSVNN